ncbi:3' 5'-cyclic adenosine monophosphate phosphodiesterase CpdA, partial [termite gut metagenome]
MKKISFLHLSDLHIGSNVQKGLISQTKEILFGDIKFILKQIGSLDVVFFTGDLVQSGAKDEYQQLESFLLDLWHLLTTNGLDPILLCVPGNHDLERIENQHNPILKTLLNWESDQIKEEYFWTENNEYLNFISERFNNFTEWYNTTSIKKPQNMHLGYLPGDFYCSLPINDIKLGVIGLNSSFLQLDGSNFQEKLGIYNKQIHTLFKDSYKEWLREQQISVLLTHHAPNWYERNSKDEYNSEIYCLNSFVEHLCGHMHEPINITTGINGFPAKRIFISPSLFGLEKYESTYTRIHGYTAGLYCFEEEKIKKTIWPRISIKTTDGTIKISQNENFNIDKGALSLTEIISLNSGILEESNSSNSFEESADNLFIEKKFIDNLPRTIYKKIDSYNAIRIQERNKAIEFLLTNRCCWITTKYGLGEEEFIGYILDQTQINPGNCFSMECDEISTINDLIELFTKVFSLNITEFFNIINSLDHPLLVLNRINENLIENIAAINEFIKLIFDFCSNLRIIIISGFPSDNRFFNQIELFPLEIPAVRQYIENSSAIQSFFTHLEYEKIHRLSSGIPIYIDKIIEQLAFCSLSDISDMEFEISVNDQDGTLPITIKNTIKKLKEEKETMNNRIFDLLSILSLLYNGETYEHIKRIIPTKPFHVDEITYLLKHKLIETTPVNLIFDNDSKNRELIKIIKVSRVIRDYVLTLLTNDEKSVIYKSVCDLYLGKNWRKSIKIIQSKDVELNLIVYQNIQIAIRFLLKHSIEARNELEITRMSHVSLRVVNELSNRCAYKDAASLAEDILSLLPEFQIKELENTKLFLRKSLGQNLRMGSFYDKSIEILKSICNDKKNKLSEHDRNSIRLSIAYAYKAMDQREEITKYADLIKESEKNKNSSLYLSAESIIAELINDRTTKISKLKAIRSKAIKYNFTTLITNITLKLCKLEPEKTQLKQLDKIIDESKNDIYNKVRALTTKAEIILTTKAIGDITDKDL